MTAVENIFRGLVFEDAVAGILAEHSSFAWNRSLTRIRCSAEGCGTVMDAADGKDAILVFARHQAGQLPAPAGAGAALPVPANDETPAETPVPAGATMPDIEPADLPDTDPQPEGHPVDTLTEPVPEAALEPAAPEVAAPAKKSRRDTKALGAAIAEIKKGDRITAFFNHPRYGEFAVEGTVIQGGAGQDRNQLMVGGWYLNIGERAAKYVQDLVIVATAGNHEFDIPKPSEATEHVGIGG